MLTKNDLKQEINRLEKRIETKFDKRIDRLAVMVQKGFEQVDKRFGQVDKKLDKIETIIS